MTTTENTLNDKFADEYDKIKQYDFQMWFPDLVVINQEPTFIELEFRLSSDNSLDDSELLAIQKIRVKYNMRVAELH